MDKDTIIKEIFYIVLAVIGLTWKYFKDRKNAKKDNEELRIQMAEAALKLAEAHKEQLKGDADKLRKELQEAAEKLAQEHARQLAERERREAEEKKLRDERRGIEFNNKIDRDVRHAEDKIKFEFKAQRMYVIHFSNVVVTEAGIHLMKLTFKHEVVERYDVEKISMYFNEKPIPEMFKNPMTRALGGEHHYIPDTELMDIKSDINRRDYYDWLCAYRVRSTLWIPIKDRTGKVVAILVSHWFAPTHFAPADISKMKDMKNDIEAIYDSLK